jgi:hypothetical protein
VACWTALEGPAVIKRNVATCAVIREEWWKKGKRIRKLKQHD